MAVLDFASVINCGHHYIKVAVFFIQVCKYCLVILHKLLDVVILNVVILDTFCILYYTV